MSRPNSTPSPLEEAAGAAGPAATRALKQLASEKRLAILLALWELHTPFEDDRTVPFSVLRKRVGMRDKGHFHYHLDKLEGHFVRKSEDGYELSRAGQQVVRTVIAGTGIEDHSLEPTEVAHDCYLCGAPTVVTYEDELLFWLCTECDGLVDRESVPEGLLGSIGFDPAGFTERGPEEVLNAAWTGGDYHAPLGGVCDACSGPMDRWLEICENHTDEGVCPDCGWRYTAVARFRCGICKRHFDVAPWWLVLDHPAVVAFYYDRGVPLAFEDGVHFQPRIESGIQTHLGQDLVSMDPIRVRVTVQYEGAGLELTLDEDLDVVDIRERATG